MLYGEWSERWGREAAGLLLRRAPETDAIFCGSDQIARGAGDAMRAAGRRVPDDIAIVGFDNWEPMVLGADPPLSSVDMCLEDIGRAAAEDLLAAIGGEPARGVRTVPSRLVVRASSAPCLGAPVFGTCQSGPIMAGLLRRAFLGRTAWHRQTEYFRHGRGPR